MVNYDLESTQRGVTQLRTTHTQNKTLLKKKHYQFNNHTDNQMRSMSIYVMNKRAVSMVNLSFK